jgi:hypothetical protein
VCVSSIKTSFDFSKSEFRVGDGMVCWMKQVTI